MYFCSYPLDSSLSPPDPVNSVSELFSAYGVKLRGHTSAVSSINSL